MKDLSPLNINSTGIKEEFDDISETIILSPLKQRQPKLYST